MIYNISQVNLSRFPKIFLDEYGSFGVSNKLNPSICGTATRLTQRESILASIGEYFERYSLVELNRRLSSKKSTISGIELLNGKKICFDSRDISKFVYFSDTCGCACHINSRDLVNNAFSEFIERQSFVLRYLTKTGRYKLKIDKEIFEELIPKELSFLEFYDVSMIDSYYVILSTGVLDDNFYISLGADYCLNNAIRKSIKEIMQIRGYYMNVRKKYVTRCKQKESKKDYFDYFMDIDTEKINKAYSFLADYPEKRITFNDLFKSSNFRNVLLDLRNRYNINPILFFIKSSNSVFKIAKIVDFNWFPTLLPKTISEEKIKNIEKITGLTIDRKCNFIPFP